MPRLRVCGCEKRVSMLACVISNLLTLILYSTSPVASSSVYIYSRFNDLRRSCCIMSECPKFTKFYFFKKRSNVACSQLQHWPSNLNSKLCFLTKTVFSFLWPVLEAKTRLWHWSCQCTAVISEIHQLARHCSWQENSHNCFLSYFRKNMT